jgi:protein kinase A
MPTLGGLLKRKKTGSKDLTSPASPTITEAATDHHRQASESQTPEKPAHNNHDSSTSASKGNASENPMNSATSQAAHHTASSQPSQHQNVASINNIINPPHQDADGGARHGAEGSQAQGQDLLHHQTTKAQPRQTKGKYSLDDFTLQRTLGTGSFGRVHLVQSRHNHRFYAIKVLKKGQVVKMKQVEHTNDERRMLQRVKHPFLITLWGTFQDSKNLYMVMDFVEGGELFSLLRKSQVRKTPHLLRL